MFDWRLYQDGQLIEEYLSLNIKDNKYHVDDNLHFNIDDKKVIRKTDEHFFEIDLKNKKMSLELDNYKGELGLYKAEFLDNNNEITITYQISKEEPLFKIVITRRNK